MNGITPVCGTFPFRHLILKVLYQIPTLLVGVPPSATDKGQPELINEGRMLADERENVRFIFADRENWQRKRGRTMFVWYWKIMHFFFFLFLQSLVAGCLNSFYLLCWDRRFSTAQTQKTVKQKLSIRDLPQLPEREARSASPAHAPVLDVSLRKVKHSPRQRHSMQIGAQLPLPHSVALPQEEDTAHIQPASDSDEEEERPAAEVGDEKVKIKLPSGDYQVVDRSPRRASQELPHIQYEDDDKMYMVPFEAKDSLKPKPAMLVNLKSTSLPRSTSLQTQQFSQIVDSDYAEPINSLRPSPRLERKHKEGEPAPLSMNPPTKSGSVENLYAPVIKQPKKVAPEPPARKASLEKGPELLYAVPDKPKTKVAPPKPPVRTASLEKEQEALYAVPDKQRPKTTPKPPVGKASPSGAGEPEKEEVVYAIPDRSKPRALPPPILHEKPKFGASHKSPSCEYC